MGENFGYCELASSFLELLAFARSWIFGKSFKRVMLFDKLLLDCYITSVT